MAQYVPEISFFFSLRVFTSLWLYMQWVFVPRIKAIYTIYLFIYFGLARTISHLFDWLINRWSIKWIYFFPGFINHQKYWMFQTYINIFSRYCNIINNNNKNKQNAKKPNLHKFKNMKFLLIENLTFHFFQKK